MKPIQIAVLFVAMVACSKAKAPEAPVAPAPAEATAQAPAVADAGKQVTTASGLRYEDVKVGTGSEASGGRVVSVHYTGWLNDNGKRGTKFDSSVDRGFPFEFPLGAGQVIAGWDEGVAGMKVGGKRVLYIPSKLAYGEMGAGTTIPPNADLIFDVELLEVK